MVDKIDKNGESRRNEDLLRELSELRGRLTEAEDALRAIREGEADAIIVSGARGEQVFTLDTADRIYRLVVQTMEEAALTVAPDSTILFCNASFGELVDRPIEKVVGRPLREFVAPEHRETVDLLIRDDLARAVRRRIVFERPDGVGVPTQVSSTVLEQDDVVNICMVATDLSELEASVEVIDTLSRSQESLRKSGERFELLSNTASLLLSVRNPQEMIQALCTRVMEILECDVFFNYLIGDRRRRLYLNSFGGIPESVAARIQWMEPGQAVCGEVARDGVRYVGEDIADSDDPRTELVRSLGVRAYACHPLVVHNRVLGTLSFGTCRRDTFSDEDLSLMKTVADQVAIAMERIEGEQALKKAKAELEQRVRERTIELFESLEELQRETAVRRQTEEDLRETNAELERLTGQLRRLTGELAMAEQQERQKLVEVLHDSLQQLLVAARFRINRLQTTTDVAVRQAADEISDLLGESLDVSRSLTADLSPPILREGTLRSALESLAGWMKDRYGLDVDLRAKGEVVVRRTETRVLLYQAVREMLFNVVKHSHARSAAVELVVDARSLRITVADEGVGFDTSFLREDLIGEGLGLFSVRQRIALINGHMEIESAPGKGCRVTLTAPLEGIETGLIREETPAPRTRLPAGAPEDGRARPAGGRHITVLVADDHEIMRQGLVQLLKEEDDIEVIGEAEDGISAVALARRFRPDVVIMDVSMPRMNGVDATRIISSELPEVHVLGLSMYEERERAQAMRDAGATDYLTKSGSPDALITAIRACRGTTRSISPSTQHRSPST